MTPTPSELCAQCQLPAASCRCGQVSGTPLLDAAWRTLSRHQPASEEDADARVLFLTHLSRTPETLHRACHTGHLTASVYVVNTGGEVLLTHHARYQQWQQLGGHLEAHDSTLEDAALREAREESGLMHLHLVPVPVQLVTIPVNCPQPGSYHFDLRYLVLAQSSRYQVSDESLDLGWFTPDRMPTQEESVLDGARRAVALAAQLGHHG